MRILQRNLKRT